MLFLISRSVSIDVENPKSQPGANYHACGLITYNLNDTFPQIRDKKRNFHIDFHMQKKLVEHECLYCHAISANEGGRQIQAKHGSDRFRDLLDLWAFLLGLQLSLVKKRRQCNIFLQTRKSGFPSPEKENQSDLYACNCRCYVCRYPLFAVSVVGN